MKFLGACVILLTFFSGYVFAGNKVVIVIGADLVEAQKLSTDESIALVLREALSPQNVEVVPMKHFWGSLTSCSNVSRIVIFTPASVCDCVVAC